MKKIAVLLVCAGALWAQESANSYTTRLTDIYSIGEQRFLITDNGAVFRLELADEHEQSWGEWFMGQKPPQTTPGTAFQPQNWNLQSPLSVEKEQVLASPKSYPYVIRNTETGEIGFAASVDVTFFLTEVRKAFYNRGYKEAEDSLSAAQNTEIKASYSRGYKAGYGVAVDDTLKNEQTRLNASYNKGYDVGLKEGRREHAVVQQEQLSASYKEGYATGQSDAKNLMDNSYKRGYEIGYKEAQNKSNSSYNIAYDKGYTEAKQQFEGSYNRGYDEGYKAGKNESSRNNQNQ